MKDDELKKFMDEHADLMRDLGSGLMCPSCKKVCRGEFYNLGRNYNWAEGCKPCAEKEAHGNATNEISI